MQIRIIALIVLLAAAFAIPADTCAQMCQSTGNVELTISPESSSSSTISLTFTNHNEYLVTVDAGIFLKSTGDETKSISRTFVIDPKGKKNLSFDRDDLGFGSNCSPYDCSCRFTVVKCD